MRWPELVGRGQGPPSWAVRGTADELRAAVAVHRSPPCRANGRSGAATSNATRARRGRTRRRVRAVLAAGPWLSDGTIRSAADLRRQTFRRNMPGSCEARLTPISPVVEG